MEHIKSAPPYTVRAYRDPYSGQIVIEPRFKKGRWPAFKVWEKRALDARDELLRSESDSNSESGLSR